MTAYLIGAYAAFWAGTFIYLLTLGARLRALSRELEDLRAALDEQG